MVQVPDKDEFSQSKRQMQARIDVCMGGKVAEEVIFGQDAVTSGARSDLQQATSLARHMVTECGMSDELGELHFSKQHTCFLPHPACHAMTPRVNNNPHQKYCLGMPNDGHAWPGPGELGCICSTA